MSKGTDSFLILVQKCLAKIFFFQDKKRDKKEKTGEPTAQQDEAAALPMESLTVSDTPSTSASAPAPASAPAAAPAASAEPEAEEDGGLGLGLGGGKKRPKKKPKAQQQQTDGGQGAPGQGRGRGQPVPSAFPPRGQGDAPTSAFETRAPGPADGPPAMQKFAPQQAPGFGSPQQPTPVGPPTPHQPPGQAPPGVIQRPQQRPGGPQRGQGEPPASQALSKVSRYTIPSRIDGNRVRARQIKMLVNYLAMKITPMKVVCSPNQWYTYNLLHYTEPLLNI